MNIMKKNKITTLIILGMLIILPFLGFFTIGGVADSPSYVGIYEEDEYEWASSQYNTNWVQFFDDGMDDTMNLLFNHGGDNLTGIYDGWVWDTTPPQAYWPLTVDAILPENTSQLLLSFGIDDLINYTQVNCSFGYEMPDWPQGNTYYPLITQVVNDTSSFAKQSLYGGMASNPYWIMGVPFAPTNINWVDFATECQAEIGNYWGPWVENTTITHQADGYLMNIDVGGYENNTESIRITVQTGFLLTGLLNMEVICFLSMY